MEWNIQLGISVYVKHLPSFQMSDLKIPVFFTIAVSPRDKYQIIV